MRYRREIDGLRALAVLPVLFFHAGSNAFGGGFVGVDIFFVISGYLITTIIVADLEKGQFSLAKFYERRARRILPLLFLVMGASTIAAWYLLHPRDMLEFTGSVLAASTFWSNIFFWLESDYFSAAAELKPLLHTWSLSVEEQYYIIFPLFMILIWRFGRKSVATLLLLLLLGGLAVSYIGTMAKPMPSFYLLPTRGWEIMLGAVAAMLPARIETRLSARKTGQGLSLAGLGLIVFSIFYFDETTPFPGIHALVPTTGAFLIIVSARDGNVVQRLLASSWMVGIGLISYSMYLWHQPIFAFTRHWKLAEPSPLLMTFVFAMVIPLSYLSWRFVEQPFRSRKIVKTPFLLAFVGIVGSIMIAIGVLGKTTGGFESRSRVPDYVSDSLTRSPLEELCFNKELVHTRDDWYCKIGARDVDPSFVVFGDSHSLSVVDVYDSGARSIDKSGIYTGISGCIPFLDLYTSFQLQKRRNCHALNKRVFSFVKDNPGIKTIYLVARWAFYTDGGYQGDEWAYISVEEPVKPSRRTSRLAFDTGLQRTIISYSQIGVKVVVLSQVPPQTGSPATLYFRAFESSDTVQEVEEKLLQFSVSEKLYKALQEFPEQEFSKYFKPGEFEVLNFDHELCDSGVCRVGDAVHSYYYDDDHLSIEGAKRLEGAIVHQLRNNSK